MIASLLTAAAVLAALAGPGDEPASGHAGKTPKERLSALMREHEAEQKAHWDSIDANPDQEEKLYAKHSMRRQAFGERALKLALDHPTEPVAVDALTWILVAHFDSSEQALKILASEHIQSDRLAEACRSADSQSYTTPAAENLLREAITKSPHSDVRGVASLSLAEVLRDLVEVLRYVKQHPDKAKEIAEDYEPDEWKRIAGRNADELTSEAERLYERVIESYAGVRCDDRFGRRQTLGQVARGKLFSFRNLVIGKTAPEIEGTDVDGNSFKLSDYRGKVVLLTFSGNWCGPCIRDYPHERTLVERLKGKPFVMLSVNTDQDKDTLRKAISSGEISWRCWWDGGTSGPIALSWGMSTFPTVFILDGRGVIRYQWIREEEELNRAVDSLLEEIQRPTVRPEEAPTP